MACPAALQVRLPAEGRPRRLAPQYCGDFSSRKDLPEVGLPTVGRRAQKNYGPLGMTSVGIGVFPTLRDLFFSFFIAQSRKAAKELWPTR